MKNGAGIGKKNAVAGTSGTEKPHQLLLPYPVTSADTLLTTTHNSKNSACCTMSAIAMNLVAASCVSSTKFSEVNQLNMESMAGEGPEHYRWVICPVSSMVYNDPPISLYARNILV